MLTAPPLRDRQAEVRNGRQEKAMAGRAIRAEIQWKRLRVAGPISENAPAQTATESSMTLPAAKPATAMASNNRRSSRVALDCSFSVSNSMAG